MATPLWSLDWHERSLWRNLGLEFCSGAPILASSRPQHQPWTLVAESRENFAHCRFPSGTDRRLAAPWLWCCIVASRWQLGTGQLGVALLAGTVAQEPFQRISAPQTPRSTRSKCCRCHVWWCWRQTLEAALSWFDRWTTWPAFGGLLEHCCLWQTASSSGQSCSRSGYHLPFLPCKCDPWLVSYCLAMSAFRSWPSSWTCSHFG